MIKVKHIITACSLLVFSNLAYSQYFKTLPRGARAIDLRNIKTTEINSSYNHSESESPFSYDIEADIKTLEAIDIGLVQDTLAMLAPYQEAYSTLNLGSYHLEANADLNIDVFGFGYGVTDKITAYVGLPMYQADVRMKYNRSKSNNYDEVVDILQNHTDDDTAQAIGAFVEGISDKIDVDGSFLQGLIVNQFNYQEVGDWHGEGPGDMEFGVMYNFFTQDNYGFLVTLGGVAPTGRIDDPDIIQDVGFGDGQWDAFVEFGGGISIASFMNINSWARYTYQIESEKELRVPLSEAGIGYEKAVFEEKLGDKIVYHLDTDLIVSDWVSFNLAYEYEHREQAVYSAVDGNQGYAEGLLAKNTESVTHNARASVEVSSITPFMKKNFILPASIKFTYQKMLEGRNTAKFDRYEVGFRMFF